MYIKSNTNLVILLIQGLILYVNIIRVVVQQHSTIFNYLFLSGCRLHNFRRKLD